MEKPPAAVAALILLYASAAPAQDPAKPSFSFDGYGTVGVVHSDEDQADFVSDLFAPEGAGATSEWSAEVDSRLGLQLATEVTPRLSGVVQLLVKQRYDDTYKPAVEWANVEYDVTPGLSVRAGRMVLPFFMVGEYRNVGYAQPWIRPPQEVYRVLPVSNTDGVGTSYRVRWGAFTNTLRGTFGGIDTNLAGGGEVEARRGFTVVNTLERGAATLLAGYSVTRLTIETLNPLFDAFRQFGPEGRAIADRYDVDGKRTQAVSLGARYDPGDWFVMGEWAASEARTFIGDIRGWYVTGGFRYQSFTPYLTLARARVASNTSDPGLSLAGLPPAAAGQARGLNEVLNQLLGAGAEQNSVSVGVRWDFTRNAALKLQYDHLDLDEGSPGVLINPQPGFEPGGTVNLFSVALDFVF